MWRETRDTAPTHATVLHSFSYVKTFNHVFVVHRPSYPRHLPFDVYGEIQKVEERISKRDEVIGGWRKLHNEVLYNVYGSPSIIRIIKSRRMRLEGNIARMGEKRNAYRVLVGKPE
jgi:hypothetical protein